MSDEEYYQWRIFYPVISNDKNIRTEKNLLIAPFTLSTKLNMLSITDEKHSSYIDIYFPLGTADVCLKLHDIEKTHNSKIEIEIRNRHKEQQLSSPIQHWSIYEIKHPRIELPDKILGRLDHLIIEQINKYLQIIINEQNLTNRTDLSYIKIQKQTTIWQVNDSDRQLEETDIDLIINDDDSSKEKSHSLYVPTQWRTLAIQTSDNEKLLKTLTTLQIENDKDLLDYFSLLISQTRFSSLSRHHQQQSLPTLTSEKAYMSLLTMSYAAFSELIQCIQLETSDLSI